MRSCVFTRGGGVCRAGALAGEGGIAGAVGFPCLDAEGIEGA